MNHRTGDQLKPTTTTTTTTTTSPRTPDAVQVHHLG